MSSVKVVSLAIAVVIAMALGAACAKGTSTRLDPWVPIDESFKGCEGG